MHSHKEHYRKKISSSEFDKSTPEYEIKRVGNQIVIRSRQKDRGLACLASKANIEALRKSIEKNKGSAKIQVTGLSRAQLGRIVGDLQENSSKIAYVRKKAITKGTPPQATNFEILMKEAAKEKA